MRLSSNYYIPLQQIRFVRILDNNTIYINLYFSHTNRKDNYYCIAYNIVDDSRYLLHCNNHQNVIWKD